MLICMACSRTGRDVVHRQPCPGCGGVIEDVGDADEHDRVIQNRLREAAKAKGVTTMQSDGSTKPKTLFTIEITETPKAGVYSIHAFDENGLQIGQTPCAARVGRVVGALADLIVNAGLTENLPLVGIEEYQRLDVALESPPSPPSSPSPKSKRDEDGGPDFTDMMEGLAGWLRKAGKK